MSQTLIQNGFVVTVDAERSVHPGGFVAIDGARISQVGPSSQAPTEAGFDEVIDAAGSIVVPGLINMHQHHWYTLFKGIADGLLLEDWVTGVLLPLSLRLDAAGDADLEHRGGHGDARDRHHLLVQSLRDHHHARIGGGLDRAAGRARHPAGLCQGAALQHAGQSAPSAQPGRGARGVRAGGRALERPARRAGALRHGDRVERPLGRRRHEHRGADRPRLPARQASRPQDHHAHFGRHLSRWTRAS